MGRIIITTTFIALTSFLAASTSAQTAKKAATTADSPSMAERGAKLAETGHCAAALPLLKKSFPQTSGKDLKLKIGFDAVRCAMTLNQSDLAVDFLRVLNREFPRAPEVLYLSVHIYSDLSTRASQDLLADAPDSYQAHQLNAESLEVQGKWDEAAAEYRRILERNPHVVGIHFRLGRILVSKPDPDSSVTEQARREFQQELEIDPTNAGAEYVLGELARQAQQMPEAIEHFTRATRLDAGFVDAFLALGVSLISTKQYSDAIPPLETTIKLQPANPSGHYNLAIAYRRVGRNEDAARETALHRQTLEKLRAEGQPGSQETQDSPPPQ
ncbi:MAG TPA: tetratricopeptide repeat protein [Candidatus Dormibacteraeota bacterium]|nr:tetratricopeptide repeat protein [Candidatus Dormibacteraeota bacterium]